MTCPALPHRLDVVTSDGMEGTYEEAEKEASSVVLIYMFIAPQQGGDSTCLLVFDGHVQLSTLLFPRQYSLTAQHANTHRQTRIHISQLCLLGEQAG